MKTGFCVRDPRVTIAFAMTFLVLALVLNQFVHLTTRSGQDITDGLQGMLFGMSIGMGLLGVRRARLNRNGQS